MPTSVGQLVACYLLLGGDEHGKVKALAPGSLLAATVNVVSLLAAKRSACCHSFGLRLAVFVMQEHVLPTLADILSQSASRDTTLVEAALDLANCLLKPSQLQQAERVHAALSAHVLQTMMQHDDPAVLTACCTYMRCCLLCCTCCLLVLAHVCLCLAHARKPLTAHANSTICSPDQGTNMAFLAVCVPCHHIAIPQIAT